MRASILSAVTGRQAMGELQFKTGMTPAALGRLKAEFSARATDLGTLDLQAFREIMLLQFPGLKEDPSVVDKVREPRAAPGDWPPPSRAHTDSMPPLPAFQEL